MSTTAPPWELDADLASALAARLDDSNVEVVNADTTDVPLEDGRFTGAVSLIMLAPPGSTAIRRG